MLLGETIAVDFSVDFQNRAPWSFLVQAVQDARAQKSRLSIVTPPPSIIVDHPHPTNDWDIPLLLH